MTRYQNALIRHWLKYGMEQLLEEVLKRRFQWDKNLDENAIVDIDPEDNLHTTSQYQYEHLKVDEPEPMDVDTEPAKVEYSGYSPNDPP